MIWFIFFIGVLVGVLAGVVVSIIVDKSEDGGDLYIYPDETGRMCTVASFSKSAVDRLEHDPSYDKIILHVVRIGTDARDNIASYNEESSTTVL